MPVRLDTPPKSQTTPALVLASIAFASLVALGMDGAGFARGAEARTDGKLDFGRDVLPILSDKCFACHGPDEKVREADLRFDRREDAFRDLGGYFAIVAGNSADSELYLRISDPDDPMPPADFDKHLSAAEIETLRRWIDEGAEWAEHWAYVAPVRAEPPAVSDERWPRGAIDRFILVRLDAEGIAPAREATREALIRRATLDITGLPPTIDEIDAFLADEEAGAYERVVDRLLASPRYGEHMARSWLDAARYGDTHGLSLDNEREIWLYRDWVIRAFNRNQPFDQFTIDQLAGDLREGATLDQRIATGFNRCNLTTSETGVIDEEYFVKYTVDRVDTVATTWLGMTMECAQCHDHKFDPISQTEYYEFFAFFGNLAGSARDGNLPYPEPFVEVPSPEQSMARRELTNRIDEIGGMLAASDPELDRAQADWEQRERARQIARWTPIDLEDARSIEGAVVEVLVPAASEDLTAVRVEVEPMAELAGLADLVVTEVEVSIGSGDAFVPVTLVDARADETRAKFDPLHVIDGKPTTGWIGDDPTEPHVLYILAGTTSRADDQDGSMVRIRVHTSAPSAPDRHLRISTSTDPSLAPLAMAPWWTVGPLPRDPDFELSLPSNGQPDFTVPAGPDSLRWIEHPDWEESRFHKQNGSNGVTYRYRSIRVDDADGAELGCSFSLGTFRLRVPPLATDDTLAIWLNGELVLDHRVGRAVPLEKSSFEWDLQPGENHLLVKATEAFGGFAFALREDAQTIGGMPIAVARELEDSRASPSFPVQRYYRLAHDRRLRDELAALGSALRELDASIPRTLVTAERDRAVQTHFLIRGQYDQKGGEVSPGTPAHLPPLPADTEGRRANRLDLAQWLTDPSHPLTARVAVNRFWQEIFGIGFVRTSEDFGLQGERPTHAELLDWLAVDFVEHGWDVKRLVRQIVTSATYRQSSAVSYDERAADPDNRLLARAPRSRLDAERIRDSALAVGGLLIDRIGGRSVRPYQPSGLWKPLAYTGSNTGEFERDHGDALYRRSLYTFWKRTSPPPTMQLFDAPTRESCEMRRTRTNTPLQALALMNDEQFVEAARAFAERILSADVDSDRERAVLAFRTATARRPTDDETAVVLGLLREGAARFEQDPEAAERLLSVGESVPDPQLDAVRLAAWTVVANLILNLDEVVTKG